MRTSIIGLLTILGLASALPARNIRLIKPGEVDATDIASLVATATRGCKTDREKMIALWGYIARSGFYHWCEAREGPEAATELGVVFDPIAALNVHGTVICYQVSDMLANLADAAGIKTRTRGIPGHKLMEAFYDGKWHLFDATYDCASYFVADDGRSIVDLNELCRDAGGYIRKPKFPSRPFYQFDRYAGKFWKWESKEYVIKNWYNPGVPAKAHVFEPYIARGHTIHLDLRRGEKLVRSFGNEGKWFCSAALYKRWHGDETQKWVDKGPHDPRRPENTYANGVLVYEPDWKASETNFRDGLHEGRNFVLREGKVHPAKAGSGYVIFRVHSPYLLAGRPGRLEVDGDSRDGAVFQADFFRGNARASNSVAVSTDNGISWQPVWSNDKLGRRTLRLDLTNRVEGRYGYLIRISLSAGKPAEASVANMKLRNCLFFSPIPLPAIRPGENRFALSVREGEGVLCLRPNLGDAKGFARYFKEVEGLRYNSNFVRHLSPVGGEGHAVMEVRAPAGAKIEWMTVHASFGAASGSAAGESAEILYRTGEMSDWRSAWKSRFSRRNDKWRWDRSVDIRLARREAPDEAANRDVEASAESCRVKFRLRQRRWMSLNRVRIHAGYLRQERPLRAGGIRIVHSWLEDGRPRSHTVRPDVAGQTYTIRAGGGKIRNRSVSIEVANETAAEAGE